MSCVLQVVTNGAETGALTIQAKNKLAAIQTKVERSLLNITCLCQIEYMDSHRKWTRGPNSITENIQATKSL